MSNFVQKVRPNFPALAGKREMSGQRVFNYVPVIPVIKFEQKTALRYRLVKDASWVFELSRYDSFRSPSANIPESTHWGAMFWNSEWDHYLGQNADLEIGKAARYEPSLTTFFPKGFTTASTGSDSGLKDFLLNMKAVVELLDQLKEKQ